MSVRAHVRWCLVVSLVSAVLAAVPASAPAETIALIGTGNVGGALGRRFAENGHAVVYGSRDPRAAKRPAS